MNLPFFHAAHNIYIRTFGDLRRVKVILLQWIQTNILVIGLLFSSPGIHESSMLLSSWPVNSKSKGGFGRAVNQMNTKQIITIEYGVSSVKKSLHSNQKNSTDTAVMTVSMQFSQNRYKMEKLYIRKLPYINMNLYLILSPSDCDIKCDTKM